MKKKRFVCKMCGDQFEIEVFEKGEAEEKGLPSYPIRCRNCGGGSVEEA